MSTCAAATAAMGFSAMGFSRARWPCWPCLLTAWLAVTTGVASAARQGDTSFAGASTGGLGVESERASHTQMPQPGLKAVASAAFPPEPRLRGGGARRGLRHICHKCAPCALPISSGSHRRTCITPGAAGSTHLLLHHGCSKAGPKHVALGMPQAQLLSTGRRSYHMHLAPYA